jgi:sensor histidine kinase YesM
MDTFKDNSFIFSSKYHIWRHVAFWIANVIFIVLLYSPVLGLGRSVIHNFIWLPARFLYTYPLILWFIPKYLLKNKYIIFSVLAILWAIGGWFLNIYFRQYFFDPIQVFLKFVPVAHPVVQGSGQPGSYLVLVITATIASMIVVFKYWIKTQRQWMQAEKDKITVELQLLKAQVHPHFLFNTLNNIYSFSLENSPKTPGLILKLSSLLSYMLYDCKAEEVLLEKEIEIMKNYIDLEEERYGNKIEISWDVEGDVKDKFIAPLLMLPFLENAFKHGTSEQLEKPWLSVDISVRQDALRCKIANSKNEYVPFSANGIGIQNVKKRLEFIYPASHELKINDEGNFFVVSLLIGLKNKEAQHLVSSRASLQPAENVSI